MYRQFAFEGSVHAELDCVPLTVRRKLDLAARKIALAGWQTLPRAERLALCHLPVDAPGDLAVYVEVFETFCARAGVSLAPLAPLSPEAWSRAAIPPAVVDAAARLGAPLSFGAWCALDEEERYALWKYADKYVARAAPDAPPKLEKLGALFDELGLLDRESRESLPLAARS